METFDEVKTSVQGAMHTLIHLGIDGQRLAAVTSEQDQGLDHIASETRRQMRAAISARQADPDLYVSTSPISPSVPETSVDLPLKVHGFFKALGALGTSPIQLELVEKQVFPH